MKPIVKGMFARSLAGHDKGKLYVISDVQEPYVFLVDGKIRTAARPKKKKLIHVQPDYEMTDAVRDEDIRKALKEIQMPAAADAAGFADWCLLCGCQKSEGR